MYTTNTCGIRADERFFIVHIESKNHCFLLLTNLEPIYSTKVCFVQLKRVFFYICIKYGCTYFRLIEINKLLYKIAKLIQYYSSAIIVPNICEHLTRPTKNKFAVSVES